MIRLCPLLHTFILLMICLPAIEGIKRPPSAFESWHHSFYHKQWAFCYAEFHYFIKSSCSLAECGLNIMLKSQYPNFMRIFECCLLLLLLSLDTISILLHIYSQQWSCFYHFILQFYKLFKTILILWFCF